MTALDMATTAAFTPPQYEVLDRHRAAGTVPSLRALRRGFAELNVAFTDTQIEDDFVDPIQKKIKELIDNQVRQYQAKLDTESRLRELQIDADLNEEAFSEASANDLRQFLSDVGAVSRPGIFLLDNGNLRAVWRNGNEQVGLQFLGGGRVQFVMFFRRPGSVEIFRELGTDIVPAIHGRIEANNCVYLLRG